MSSLGFGECGPLRLELPFGRNNPISPALQVVVRVAHLREPSFARGPLALVWGLAHQEPSRNRRYSTSPAAVSE